MTILKEIFYQPGYEGIPPHWVVQFWEDDPSGFPDAAYFDSKNEADEFAETLTQYEDWMSSQEMPLATQ